MTDEGILYKYIDLSECHLTDREKEEIMDLIIVNKQAFSLSVIYLGFGSSIKERLLYTLNKMYVTQVKSC